MTTTLTPTLADRAAMLLGIGKDLTYADITKVAGGAAPAAAASEKASPFPAGDKEYIRPNGLVYLPRNLNVDGNMVQDVILLRESIAAGMPVLLYGEPGCGKTAMVEAAFGTDLYTVQGTIETETADFVGSWAQQPDGRYHWVDGPLPLAMEQGKKLLVDEIALIDPRVMAIVYGVMDGRGELVVTQNPTRGAVKAAEGFAVVGACNPNVPGANMSDALLSRFQVHIEMTTDWSLAAKLGVPSKITQVVRNLNSRYANGELTAAPQLRELLTFRDVAAKFGEQFALRNFVGQVRPENRHVVVSEITRQFGAEIRALTF